MTRARASRKARGPPPFEEDFDTRESTDAALNEDLSANECV